MNYTFISCLSEDIIKKYVDGESRYELERNLLYLFIKKGITKDLDGHIKYYLDLDIEDIVKLRKEYNFNTNYYMGTISDLVKRREILSDIPIEIFINTISLNATLSEIRELMSINKHISKELPKHIYTLKPDNSINNEFLSKFINLTSLDLEDNYIISDEGIKNLINTKRLGSGTFNLTSLNLKNNYKITDKGIKGLTNLTSLNLWGNKNITDEGIKDLVDLTSLDIFCNANITDEGLKNLTLCTLRLRSGCTSTFNLTSLSLRGNENITDKGIKNLVNLTNLNLQGNKIITDKGIKNLVNLTNLNLQGNKNITDKGIKNLVDSKLLCTGALKLTSLNLMGNKMISGKGIKYLTNLTTLDIRSNEIISIKDIEDLTQSRCYTKQSHFSACTQVCPVESKRLGHETLKLITSRRIYFLKKPN